MDFQMLLTSRLRLEPLVSLHADQLYELYQEPDLYPWIFKDPPTSLESFREGVEFLEKRLSRNGSEYWLNWVMFNRWTGECVGKIEISLCRESRQAFLAYTTFKPYWRQGYGREGCSELIRHIFEEWGSPKVWIEMDTRNDASIRLAESLGGKRIGFTPRALFFKGAWSDEYRYEIQAPNGGRS